MQATRPTRHCLQNAAATTANTTRTCSGLPTYTVLQQLKTQQQMSHQNNDHQCALTGLMSNARHLPETETNRLFEEKANNSKDMDMDMDMDMDTQLLKQFTYQEDVEAPAAATTITNNTRTYSEELPILQQLKARHMSDQQNNDYQHCDLTGFVSNTRSILETNRHEESVENFWDLTHPYTVNKEHDDHDDWPLSQHNNNLKDMEIQLTNMEMEFLTRSRILSMI